MKIHVPIWLLRSLLVATLSLSAAPLYAQSPDTVSVDLSSIAENPYLGASFIDKAGDVTFTGSTSVNVDTTLGGRYDHRNPVASDKGVFGGFSSEVESSTDLTKLQNTTATLVGDTHVTVTLNESHYNDFTQSVIGGSFASNGLNVNQTGTSYLTINATDYYGATDGFQGYIVGGNLNADSDIVDTKDVTSVIYSSANQSHTSIDKVVVTVTGGRYAASGSSNNKALFTIGSMTQGGGSVHTGSTEATLSNGYYGTIVGGNASVANKKNAGYRSAGDITSGGEDTSVGTTSINSIQLNVTDSAMTSLVGGSYISSDVTRIVGDNGVTNTQALTVGSVNVNIKGGFIMEGIAGGSYVGANISQGLPETQGGKQINYTATQGAIDLKVSGTLIVGSYIAAAGVLEAPTQIHEVSSYLENSYDILQNAFSDAIFSGDDLSTLPTLSAYTGPTGAIDRTLGMTITTESTNIELGSDIIFNSDITVTGGYHTKMVDPTYEYYRPLDEMISNMDYNIGVINGQLGRGEITQERADALLAYARDWQAKLQAMGESLPTATYDHQSIVKGNRLLTLNDGSYENMARVNFIEFDEITIGEGSSVDFSASGQDLDSFNGRNTLSADGIHVIADDYSGTNTLRKSGAGTLLLSDTNGQQGSEDNLQLVVEQGTVALAANSAATDKTNFKTLVIQSDATLDMSAGSNSLGAAAGINGDLRIEGAATIIADASRHVAGSGTSMTGGSLSVDAKFILALENVSSMQFSTEGIKEFSSASLTMDIGIFEILLFSDLHTIDGIDFVTGTWGTEEVKLALASDYLSSDFYLGNEDANWDSSDAYLMWKENGDLVLTGASNYPIPEPSTATLSLLALAGILARRRRKAV